jgi:hypothetical protein
MRHRSEERWCARWRIGLEHALVSLGEEFDSGRFAQLVGQAGGWWSWDAAQACPSFVEGLYTELRTAVHR